MKKTTYSIKQPELYKYYEVTGLFDLTRGIFAKFPDIKFNIEMTGRQARGQMLVDYVLHIHHADGSVETHSIDPNENRTDFYTVLVLAADYLMHKFGIPDVEDVQSKRKRKESQP